LLQIENKGKPMPFLSFIGTKEGTWGLLVLAGIVGLIGWGIIAIAPMVLSGLKMAALAGIYGFVLIGIGIACAVLIACAPSIYRLCMFRYQLIIKAAYRSVIEETPEEVHDYAQKGINERRERLTIGQTQTRGVVNENAKTLADFGRDFNSRKAIATRLQKEGDTEGATAELSRIGKLMDAGRRMSASQDRIVTLEEKYTRGLKALDQVEEDAALDFKISSADYRVGKSAAKSWLLMKQAFKGQSQDDELREDSLQFMKQDFERKMAQVDVWAGDCETAIKHIENKNACYADDALAMLDQLNSMSFDSVVKKQEPGQVSFTPGIPMPQLTTNKQPVSVGKVVETSYSDYIKKP
jgi:hypothetical protein